MYSFIAGSEHMDSSSAFRAESLIFITVVWSLCNLEVPRGAICGIEAAYWQHRLPPFLRPCLWRDRRDLLGLAREGEVLLWRFQKAGMSLQYGLHVDCNGSIYVGNMEPIDQQRGCL